ncbi:MAG: hypothetical protein IJI09_02295 [Clostridia bacterium]|nr:hypothetical protein [Clostridia bacterium]
MKREVRDFREAAPRPVKRIPLEIKNPRLRLALVILALAVAAGAFWYAFRQLVTVEPGWTLLEADGAVGLNVSADFRLQVELGAGSETPLAERKRLTTVYSGAAREAYTRYTAQEYVSGVSGIWYINHHPGEVIRVDEQLYRALQKSVSAGDWLYLGPAYEVWDSVWFSREDREAAAADPRRDSELAAYLAEIAGFIRSGEIRLELRGDQEVCLAVSDAYRAFGEENGITRWIDLGWQKNAFIIDDLADALVSSGWTRAVLSSRDGFIRCLDGRGSFTLNMYADTDAGAKQIAQMDYSGPASLMMLLPAPGGDRSYSYRYQDGTLRTAWISAEEGLDSQPVDGLAAYSETGGCADLLCCFLNLLTYEGTEDTDWAAASGNEISLWLARNGILSSFGSDGLKIKKE